MPETHNRVKQIMAAHRRVDATLVKIYINMQDALLEMPITTSSFNNQTFFQNSSLDNDN